MEGGSGANASLERLEVVGAENIGVQDNLHANQARHPLGQALLARGGLLGQPAMVKPSSERRWHPDRMQSLPPLI